MLSRMRQYNPAPSMGIACDDRYSRNMQEDMKEAIDLLWKFKAGLDKLHPECISIVEKMLSPYPNHY